ncbi:MAG: cation-translocating P-type ATPase [Candidatus Altiarchaeota archaeon]|nr:cation-translocating P-type ATPase [Candidatus Altiarchaeota archaeon]
MKGLSEAVVAERLKIYGTNEVQSVDKWKTLRMIINPFRDALVILLLFAASLSYFIGETLDTVLIVSIVILNGIIGFFQEYKAEKTIESIRERLRSFVKVRRDGETKEIDSRFLVPGDIVLLEAGEKVPADGTVVLGELSVDESMLTGESLPVMKGHKEEIYAGTLIVKGKATIEITGTGMNTKIGKISEMSEGTSTTPFQEKLKELSTFLGKIVIGISVVIVAIGLFQGNEVLEMVELGISLGVAAVPEGLIILSTMCLAIGVKKMADHKAIVKRLPAVEALGSIDVLCVDKTGTITENQLVVKESRGDDEASKIAASLTSQELNDPLDLALREWAGNKNPESFEPFDSDKKYAMASLKGRIYVKGAPEIIAKYCKNLPAGFEDDVHEMASHGLKVIAVASGISEGTFDFHGLIGLYDPPRKGVAKIIQTAKDMGIEIKMITGDHPETARAIATRVGITGAVVDLEGTEFSEDDVEKAEVYARVTPEDKLRIVQALQKKGLKVGMTGDGVNDAPALKKSNIGIALGSGTDIAKEAADMVLLDDNLSTIIEAVHEGRSVFLNVRKATQYLLSMNAAEVLSISISMIFGVVLFKPAQILWMNLVTDSLPALAFAYDSNPAKEKNKTILTKKIWAKIGAAGSILGLGAVGSFLRWGKAAALNTLIYSEIAYQPIVRKKYKSTGIKIAMAFLIVTVAIQLASTQYIGSYLGLSFPGAELLVVLASMGILSFV